MLVTSDSTASLLLISVMLIRYLMEQERNVKLAILLELLKKSEDWSVFMKTRSTEWMMVILFSLERLKAWLKSMEKNSKLKLNHPIVSLLEIPDSSVPMNQEVLLQNWKYQQNASSSTLKKVWDTLTLQKARKCLSLVGKNSEFQNNFTSSSMLYLPSMPNTTAFLVLWTNKILMSWRNWLKNTTVLRCRSKARTSRSRLLMKNWSKMYLCMELLKSHHAHLSGEASSPNKSSNWLASTLH